MSEAPAETTPPAAEPSPPAADPQVAALRKALKAVQKELRLKTDECRTLAAQVKAKAGGGGADRGGKLAELQKLVQTLTVQLTSTQAQLSSSAPSAAASAAAGDLEAARKAKAEAEARATLLAAENAQLREASAAHLESEADDVRMQLAALQQAWDGERATLEQYLAEMRQKLSAAEEQRGSLEAAAREDAEEKRGQRIALREAQDALAHTKQELEAALNGASGAKAEAEEHRAAREALAKEKAEAEEERAELAERIVTLEKGEGTAKEELERLRTEAQANASAMSEARDMKEMAVTAMERTALHQDVMQKIRGRLNHIQSELLAISHTTRAFHPPEAAEGVAQVLLDLANKCAQLAAYREDEVNRALAAAAAVTPGSVPTPQSRGGSAGSFAGFSGAGATDDDGKPMFTPWVREAADGSAGTVAYTVDSPLVARILAEWSSVKEKQQYLKLWLSCIIENRKTPAKFPQGVHLTGLAPSTFESFRTIVGPLLTGLPHAEVLIFSRRSSQGNFDLRFKVERLRGVPLSRTPSPGLEVDGGSVGAVRADFGRRHTIGADYAPRVPTVDVLGGSGSAILAAAANMGTPRGGGGIGSGGGGRPGAKQRQADAAGGAMPSLAERIQNRLTQMQKP
uniref:Uncharacterized protein n=1 Tax=Phaeomonas parva TaxID=124430 RepID=A0A7S1UCV0_9STRA|mmetsp:Transcript_42223/g.132217  ORF Transcript_42223/g.132217 Transcript_42223/m.132217 type:complete len:630 (+) Transcript_42223:108-1997(+)